jgi:FkbM family methyltransferase
MIDIKTIMRDFMRARSLQEFINMRYKDETKLVLDRHDLGAIVTKSGAMFYPTQMINNALHISREIDMSDIRPTDIVVDIGACIGGFAIPAAMIARHVYAVEPLYADELQKNIVLNGLENKITVIEAGLGFGDALTVTYGTRKKTIKTMTIRELIDIGGCNFLKCDCEGAEWAIYPEDLKGIRRIELEIHRGRQSILPENPGLLTWIESNYKVRKIEKKGGDEGAYWHCFEQ